MATLNHLRVRMFALLQLHSLRKLWVLLALVLLPLGAAQWARAQQTGADFDHASTGFILNAQHQNVRCESCHLKGVFKGTPKTCEACHGWNNPRANTVMPRNHIPTANAGCESCHAANQSQFVDAARTFSHVAVLSQTCLSCHDARHPHPNVKSNPTDKTHQQALGSNTACGTCHSTIQFTGPKVPGNHIPTAAVACANCHTSSDFSAMPSISSIHANAPSGSTCAQCHSAANAAAFAMPTMVPPLVAPPANHIGTGNQSCETCHVGAGSSLQLPVRDGARFSNSKFSHAGISSGCASCHGPGITGSSFAGISAIVVMPDSSSPGPNAHIPGSTTCESCHAGSLPSGQIAATASSTVPGTGFQLPKPSSAQIHSGITSNCAACHDTNANWVGMSQYPMAGYGGFQTRPQPAAGTYNVASARHPQTGDCADCHAGISFDPNQVKRPGNHIPVSSSSTCASCHNLGDFSAMPSLSVLHANAPTSSMAAGATNCAQCHSSANAALYAMPTMVPAIVAPPANHISMGALDCGSCHVGSNSSLSLPVQNGAAFSNAAFSHSGISTGCASCHGGSVGSGTFFGVTPKTLASLSPAHVPTTLACETCHTNNVPATLIPLSGASGSMTTFAGAKFSHSGITTGCATCHGPSIGGNSFYGISQIVVMPPSSVSGANAHLPTSTTCESCHAGSTPSGLVPGVAPQLAPGSGFLNPAPTASMIHTGVTGSCASCHDTNMVWMGVSKYPITTAAPFKGFQTRPQASAGTFFVADATHPQGECATCHGSFSDFTSPSLPAIHIPTGATAVCSACHGDFSTLPTVTAIHANAPSSSANCAQCHSAANATTFNQVLTNKIVAPPANHIAMGALGCESCHVGAGSSLNLPVQNGAAFSNSAFSHSGISTGCASCHGGSVGSGTFFGVTPKTQASLSPAHVPTTLACETCHTNNVPATLIPLSGASGSMTTFAGAKFNHSGITTGCASCHGPSIGGNSFYGISQIVVMPPSSVPGANAHLPTSTTCESCHAGSTPSGLIAGVAPQLAPGSGFLNPPPTASMIHAGITGSCASCHDTNMVWMGVSKYPITTAAPYTGFQTRPQLAAGTYFVADSVHPASGDCSTCHGGFSNFTSPSLPAIHIPTGATAVCSACHGDFSTLPTVTAIHANAPSSSANCAQCHSAANATTFNQVLTNKIVAPPANHIAQGALGCESCHVGAGSSLNLPVQTGAKFSNSAFSHSGISTGCASCHGGSVGSGTFFGVTPKTLASLSPAHVPTTLACETCHTNNVPATLIPLSGASGSMTTFAGAKFSHSGITTGCASCHGPSIGGNSFYGISQIVVMPPSSVPGASSHLPTSTTCESCHAGSTPSGLIAGVAPQLAPGSGFLNPAPTASMIHAGVTGSCASCHDTNMVWMGVSKYPITTAAPYTGFQTRPQLAAGTYFVADSVHPASGDCSTCHGGFSNFNGPTLPAVHIPIAASASCAACHGDFTTPPSVTQIHANAPSTSANCAQCHSAANAANYNQNMTVKLVAPPANHIAMGALGCESCHVGSNSSLSLPVQNGAAFSNSAFSHSGISTGCASCHGGSVGSGTFFGVTPKTLASLSPAHVPTSLACETCHTNNVPATLIPLSGASGSMTTFAGAKFSHSGITTGCASCHGPSIGGNSFYGISQIVVMPPSSVPGASSHLPTSTTCESCHAGSTPSGLIAGVAPQMASGSGFLNPPPTASMIHAGVTGSCASCHDTNMVWMGVSKYPITTAAPFKGFQTRPQASAGTFFVADATHPQGECATCHGSFSDFTSPSLPAIHIPIATGAVCSSCHVDFNTLPTVTKIHANAPSTSANCAQCHSAANASNYNQNSIVKIVAPSAKHIPMGALGCESCHVAAGSSINATPVQDGARFSGALFSHAGISSGCDSCHGAQVTVSTFDGIWPKTIASLSPAHVPTTLACETCHTNNVPAMLVPSVGMTTFAGGKFSHSGISTGCETCHGPSVSNNTFYGVTRIVVMPPSSGPGASSHLPTSTTCESCHAGSTPSALVPGVATRTAPGSGFLTPAPTASMIHAGVTGSCASCHDSNMVWMGVGQYPITTAAPFKGFQTRPLATAGSFNVADASHPTAGDCSSCHGSFADFNAPSKPANHIPTSAACTACHKTASYSVMPQLSDIHANAPSSSSNCAQCHSDANAAVYNTMASMVPTIVSPPGDHIDMGNLGCEACHVGTGSSVASTPVANGAKFSGSLFNHAGKTLACSACHGMLVGAGSFAGITPKSLGGLTPAHLPVSNTVACDVCHVNSVPAGLVPASGMKTFAGAQFSHAGISTGCETCHGPNVSGSTFNGVTRIVVMPPSTAPGAASHLPTSTTCESCHGGSTPSGLVPGVATQSAPGTGFRLPAPSAAMIHAGVSGSCNSCHDSNKVWMGVDQYPITTAAPYKGFQTRPQLAAGTYFVADGVHPASGDCSTCHGGFSNFNGPSLPAIHIPIAASASCAACHGDFSALPTVAKIHANAPSTSVNCAQCHSAANAANYNQNAKRAIVTVPDKHIGMGTLGCEACHVGAGSSMASTPVPDGARFAGSLFSHSGIASGCASCHGAAVTASTFAGITPKTIASLSPVHLPTSAACESCHTNSVPAMLTPAAGMPTFAGAQFSHAGITTGCASCHGPGITGSSFYGATKIVVMPPSSAAGSSSHLPTTTTCESCHAGNTPSALVPGVATRTAPGSGFLLPAPTASQIHAGTTGSCASCHDTGMLWMGVGQYPITTAAPYRGFQTRPTATASTFGVADSAHTVGALATGDCASCHTSLSDFNAVPTNHIPYAASATCAACHKNGNYTTLPAIADIHANAQSTTANCAQCHSAANALKYKVVAPIKTVGANHVAMAALGCEACHVSSGGVTSSLGLPVQNGAVFSNAAYSHTGVTSNCVSCHGRAGPIAFEGVTPKAMTGLNPVHVPTTLACEACHTSVPAVLIPLGGGSGTNTFAGGKFSHSGISNGCDTCHGAGISGGSFYGVSQIVVLPATTPAGASTHIPSSVNAQCETCHLGSMPSTLVPAVAPSTALGSTLFKTPLPTGAQVHTGVGSGCNTCHEKTLSWLGVNLYPRTTSYTAGGTYVGFQARPVAGGGGYSIPDTAHPTTGDCSQCHGSTVNFNINAKPGNHIPVNPAAACTACHTNITAANPDFSVMPTLANIHLYAPAPVTSNCAACHSVTNANRYAIPAAGFVIKAPDTKHIPFGSTACETCHVGSGSSMASAVVGDGARFSGSLYSHTGVTTGCATCHGPTISAGSFTGVTSIVVAPPTSAQGVASHIPYTGACEVCHAGSTPAGLVTVTGAKPVPGSGFKLPAPTGVMIHANSSSFSCMSCHEANYRWMGVDQYPIAPTVVTAGANYTGFQTRPITASTPFSVADAAHAVGGLASGDCAQCHSGTTAFTAAGKPAGHMPTTASGAACTTCHSADYSVAGLSSLTALHTGIASGMKTYTATTIATKTCVTCHTVGTGGTSGTAPFTGCTTAATCATPPPQNAYQPMLKEAKGAHVPIGTLDCNGCHASFAAFSGMNMKPQPGKIPHDNAALGGVKCMNCHELGMSWFGVTNLKVRLANKHKSTNEKTQDCSQCHDIGGFRALQRPIMREALVSPDMGRIRPNLQGGRPSRGSLGNSFDHKGVAAGQCKTCHDGKAASGLPARHLMVTTSCDSCHRPTTWLPAQFSHNGITPNTCLACHNGMGASAKPPGHFMTARSCDSCHKDMQWAPVQYQHLSPLYRAAPDRLTCVSCHDTNGEIIRRQARSLNRTKPIPVGAP